MNGAVTGGRRYAPVDLTKGACPDLPALVAVGQFGPVGHRLGLNATSVPKLRATITREGRKEGGVRKHPDPVVM